MHNKIVELRAPITEPLFNEKIAKNSKINISSEDVNKFLDDNDKYNREKGTRDEYRIYHNRDIAKHELHFQPYEIVVFIRVGDENYRIEHFNPKNKAYKILFEIISKSSLRGNHALLLINEYQNLILGVY